jgi:hypothetical protein
MSDCHVHDGVYNGADPVISECFAALPTLRSLTHQLFYILHAGKQIKGTLNEDRYEERLIDEACTDRISTIITEQWYRRFEYFRTRMLLEQHLIPALEATIAKVMKAAQRVRLSSWPGYDELAALSEIKAVLNSTHLQALAKARAFVAEPDETKGFGEKAFEKVLAGKVHFYGRRLIPDEFQFIDGVDAHPLDVEMRRLAQELLDKLAIFRRDISLLEQVIPGRTVCHYASAPGAERHRLGEYMNRVWQGAGSPKSNPMEGWDPDFADTEAVAFNKAVQALRDAIPSMVSQPQRRLAQSNLLGSKVVGEEMGSVISFAQNLVWRGNHFEGFKEKTLADFDGLVQALEPEEHTEAK